MTAFKKTPAGSTKKFAKGGKVRVTRAGVPLGVGRYLGSDKKVNGEWHRVNMAAPRQTPDVRTYRAASLERV